MKRTFLRSSLICMVLILGFTFSTANSDVYDIPGFNGYNQNIEPEDIYDPLLWGLLDIGLQFIEEVYYVDYYGATLANKSVNTFISPYSTGWPQYPQFFELSDIGFYQVPKTIYSTPDLFSVQDIHYAIYGLPIFTQCPSTVW